MVSSPRLSRNFPFRISPYQAKISADADQGRICSKIRCPISVCHTLFTRAPLCLNYSFSSLFYTVDILLKYTTPKKPQGFPCTNLIPNMYRSISSLKESHRHFVATHCSCRLIQLNPANLNSVHRTQTVPPLDR
jgi:hypothetical protein